MEWLQIITLACLGALASILANRGIAVFNDGLRAIVPEYLENRLSKKELAATSFALSFGLVIGFGIPISIAASIILIHSILLGTDIIGSWAPSSKKGLIIAGVVGALWGVGISIGLQVVVDAFSKLPVDFLPALGTVGLPVVTAFSAFPALVVAMQYGFKNGLITFVLTFLGRQIFEMFGQIQIGDSSLQLNADGMALMIGMIIMIIFALREKTTEDSAKNNEVLLGIFADRVARIKKNILLLSVMGAILAAATNLALIAGDPISLNLLAEGKTAEAGIAALARAIGFVPLVATTSIATGVYGPAGTTLVFAVGLLTGNPILAFVLGFAVIFAEVCLLELIAKAMDKFPGMKACGDHIRTAMNRVLEVSLLVGGMMAANEMAPSFGFLFVTGVYSLNKFAKKPLVDMAVGPIAAIALGVVINILALLGLYTPIG